MIPKQLFEDHCSQLLFTNDLQLPHNHCVKKCLYLEFFWSLLSRIWTQYEDLLSETRKTRTKKTPNTDTFHAVNQSKICLYFHYKRQQS